MNKLRTQRSLEATDKLWALSNGPVGTVNTYSGCISNGVRFHTFERENRRIYQNSGLVVEGEGHKTSFYGRLHKVWEMTYLFGHRVVLFQCEWYNSGSNRTFRVEAHSTSIDVRSRWFKDDPFVLPSQVRQVFYVNDTLLGDNWKVVERFRHRGIWDVLEKDDSEPNHVEPNAFQEDETNGIAPIVLKDSTTAILSRSSVVIIQDKTILESITRTLNEDIANEFNTYDDDDDELMEESENEAEAEVLGDYDTDIDLET